MRIGIPGRTSGGVFGVNSDYMELAARFGTPVIITPENDSSSFDAILAPGGSDVLAGRFARPAYSAGSADPMLEWFDETLLKDALGKVPVFGICRGLQTINVLLGGTLLQNLRFHPQSSYDSEPVHEVYPCDEYGKTGIDCFDVNSFHHQAIELLGDGLVPLVWAYEFTPGNLYTEIKPRVFCEAVRGQKIFAVQWHPERLLDKFSLERFEALLKGEY